MKKLFNAIHNNEFDTVKKIIEEKPQLVNCVAKQPPKKDDGQSPLQVALKTGRLDIANYLIDAGADLNFIESEKCCNEWRTPVIHDAINCAVMSCRWNTSYNGVDYKVFSNFENTRNALLLLKKMLEKGANINALDSYGNSCLDRFCIQAKQILPCYNYNTGEESKDRLFTDELHEDLKNILILLKEYNIDYKYVSPNTGKQVMEYYKGSLATLLKEVFENND